jgi:hypothetical protein
MKITTRCGSAVIEQLNEALPAKAAEAKMLRVGRVRADTTVVAANVQRPADSRAAGKLRAAGEGDRGHEPPDRPDQDRRCGATHTVA